MTMMKKTQIDMGQEYGIGYVQTENQETAGIIDEIIC